MIADVILGKNIDTPILIRELKLNLRVNICVVDYNYTGEPTIIDEVTYLSNIDAKEFFMTFDSVCFYKSMYIYPGMYNLKSTNKNNSKDN